MIYEKHVMKLKFLFNIIICLVAFNSCKSNKALITKTFQKNLATTTKTYYKLTISPNSKLFVSKDNFNIVNVIQQKGKNLILKFEYKTMPSKNLADANYREVLFLEIPNHKQELHLTQFKNIKVWFARFCYCKDYIGYFNITNGDLNLVLNKQYLKIKMQFTLHNIPHVVNFINQKISLKP